MRFALMIEPQQGLTYREQLAIARRAEGAGFETLFRSDHYQSFPGEEGRRTTDAWAVVAGLSREVARLRLGVLVSPVTFRHPGSLAKLVTTIDEMSDGRVELGCGAGWHEREHRQLGIPFPDLTERANLLEEELAILHGLWTEPDGWSFHGRHFTVADASFHPKPIQRPHPPIIVGGQGTARSLRLAALYANEFNLYDGSPDEATVVYERLDNACLALGRDPSSIMRSALNGTVVGIDEAEFRRRVGDLLVFMGNPDDDPDAWIEAHRSNWIMGTASQALEMARRYERAGCGRLIFQVLLPRDLDMIDLLGSELLARF